MIIMVVAIVSVMVMYFVANTVFVAVRELFVEPERKPNPSHQHQTLKELVWLLAGTQEFVRSYFKK